MAKTRYSLLRGNSTRTAGASAWRNGNLNEYGRLIFESGYSSIANYECGCDELKTLYTIMRSTDGIYGGRFLVLA